MQTITPASAIPVPTIESDEPVAVIPIASVAPLDGPADGERLHTFALAPKESRWAMQDSAGQILVAMRDRVARKPFASLLVAFSLGYVLSRARR
jgi:hypothetical protein